MSFYPSELNVDSGTKIADDKLQIAELKIANCRIQIADYLISKIKIIKSKKQKNRWNHHRFFLFNLQFAIRNLLICNL